MWASLAIPKAPPPASGSRPTILAPNKAASFSRFFAITLLLPTGIPRDKISIYHESDSALTSLRSHFKQKLTHGRGVFFKDFLRRVTLNQHWFVPDELATPCIVAPHAQAAGKCGGAGKSF